MHGSSVSTNLSIESRYPYGYTPFFNNNMNLLFLLSHNLYVLGNFFHKSLIH